MEAAHIALDRDLDLIDDRDLEAGHLHPSGIEKDDVGLSGEVADDVSAARRADHDVGGLGIGHQHVLDVARKIVDERLADPECHGERGCVGADK